MKAMTREHGGLHCLRDVSDLNHLTLQYSRYLDALPIYLPVVFAQLIKKIPKRCLRGLMGATFVQVEVCCPEREREVQCSKA